MTLPKVTQPVDGPSGVSLPWYSWFRRIESLADSGSITADAAAAAITAICVALGSPDGTPEGIPDQSARTYLGLQSVQLLGRAFSLVGDADAPSATSYYGTDATGSRGFQPISNAVLPGDGVSIDVGTDGRITINANSAVPTLIASGRTYTVAANTQAPFTLPIQIDGALVLDGALVEVT